MYKEYIFLRKCGNIIVKVFNHQIIMNLWPTKNPERRVTKRELTAFTLLAICFVVSWIIIFLPGHNLCGADRVCDNREFWVTTHFILYFILGLLCPHRWILMGATVVYWEIFERVAGIRKPFYKEKIFYKTMYDIIADVTGYFLGSFLAQFLFSNNDEVLLPTSN